MPVRFLAGLLPIFAAGMLHAAEEYPPLLNNPESQTQKWLQLQREGTAASPQVQSATAAERERAMQRLLDSFTHPIPDYFGEDDGGSLER